MVNTASHIVMSPSAFEIFFQSRCSHCLNVFYDWKQHSMNMYRVDLSICRFAVVFCIYWAQSRCQAKWFNYEFCKIVLCFCLLPLSYWVWGTFFELHFYTFFNNPTMHAYVNLTCFDIFFVFITNYCGNIQVQIGHLIPYMHCTPKSNAALLILQFD